MLRISKNKQTYHCNRPCHTKLMEMFVAHKNIRHLNHNENLVFELIFFVTRFRLLLTPWKYTCKRGPCSLVRN